VPAVLDDVEGAADARAKAGHRVLDNLRHAGVERVDRLTSLKEDVGVLRRATDERPFRGQCPATVLADQFLGHQRSQVVVGEHLDRVQFVRSAEPIEEVHERHACRQRGGLRHQRQVVGLLDRRRGQHRVARLSHRHHVRVIAEDRQSLGSQRPGRHVHDGGGQLAGDLVHVRDHEQQAL